MSAPRLSSAGGLNAVFTLFVQAGRSFVEPVCARNCLAACATQRADCWLMDGLVSAFVAALLAECGDRTPWLAALLAARFQRPVAVVLGIALAAASASALSATFGALIAPMLVPNARLLFLALALLFAGAGAFLPLRAPDALAGWRIGAFATSALGFFVLEFGDRTQFLTAALALRSPVPALAAVGATLGILAISIPAALVGEAALKRLPPIATRIIPGALFLVTGLICALSALRLV